MTAVASGVKQDFSEARPITLWLEPAGTFAWLSKLYPAAYSTHCNASVSDLMSILERRALSNLQTLKVATTTKGASQRPKLSLETSPPFSDMTGKFDGLLEKGYWEEVKPEKPIKACWKPAGHGRSKSWSVNLHSLTPAIFSPKTAAPREPLRRTAWLDGLRGFAAFLVYWHHHELWSHDTMLDDVSTNSVFENTFGYKDNYYFATLPGVRVFFTGGHFAVTCFYVISGYVLCVKPLTLLQAGDYAKLGDNLGSALFRRWMRLYIPVIATTFVYMTIWHVFNVSPTAANPQENFRKELWNWYAEFKNYSFIFKEGGVPWFTYNFHSWSLPVEMKGSIVVYTSLLAFSRSTRNARLWCELGLITYFLYIADGWYCAMFVAGMLLADLDLLAQDANLPQFFYRLESFKELIFINLFCIAMYLGGVPSGNRDLDNLRANPGWYYLAYLKPQAVYDYKWFYLFWAAVFMIAAIPRLHYIKIFFETRFCQYLGRISYALYLVHGPIIWLIADKMYVAVGFVRKEMKPGVAEWANTFPLPHVGPMGLEVAFLLPHVLLLPLTLWTAELVTRFFDEPAVKFAQWFYKKTLPESPKL